MPNNAKVEHKLCEKKNKNFNLKWNRWMSCFLMDVSMAMQLWCFFLRRVQQQRWFCRMSLHFGYNVHLKRIFTLCFNQHFPMIFLLFSISSFVSNFELFTHQFHRSQQSYSFGFAITLNIFLIFPFLIYHMQTHCQFSSKWNFQRSIKKRDQIHCWWRPVNLNNIFSL